MDTGEESREYKSWNALNAEEDVDQFQILEDKIDNLISTIRTLKSERESLNEKLQIQEEKLTDLAREVETLKSGRDKARQRIVSLLEKIEQVEG